MKATLSLAEWLQEREANCRQHAARNYGAEKAGWLEDAEYFRQAAALAAPSTPAPDAAELIFRFGGFLTSSKRQWVFSSHDDANPMVEAIRLFAEREGINLAATSTPAAPTQCACGVPWTLGVVHRAKNPCFVYIEPADPDLDALDMSRLRNGDRRMLSPENQPVADALTAARAAS
jgi:hypothetical protein